MTQWARAPAKVMDMADAAHLPGAHNWQNAALAYGAVRPFVADTKAIAAAIASFPGLAHRMEDVGHIGKTVFINDSKATNADATARALAVYPDIFWIAGGKPKEGGIESLAGFFPRIRKAYLIGEAAPPIRPYPWMATRPMRCPAPWMRPWPAPPPPRLHRPCPIPLCCCRRPVPPTTSSRIFEQRGDTFRSLVAKLPRDSGARAAS